jgi:hypothetical protein
MRPEIILLVMITVGFLVVVAVAVYLSGRL